ncbi:MAG: hypothetical protein ACKVG8_01815 [Flavobacteriales bacterium]|jgi:uncharacterized membrane-anchored protein|tara:strand:- start:897 stop:1316 length:420 start_codon:yes stop_codon:yes gene_type:complete
MSKDKPPSLIKWSLKYSLSAAAAGIICCVAPAILFMFGLMGGVYAISFADFFYNDDGSEGTGSLLLKGIAVAIGLYGVYSFKKKQNQCSINPQRKWKNLIILVITITVISISVFLSLEKWSAWYFDAHIVPAQQIELKK